MKDRIIMALFFGALTALHGWMLYWGFFCPEYWENPEWLLTGFKIVGIIGLVGYPYLLGREWTIDEYLEDE